MIRPLARSLWSSLTPFAVLTALAGACGPATAPLSPQDGGDDSPHVDVANTDTAVVVPTSVGPAGGVVSGPGGAQVTIPAGALAAASAISVSDAAMTAGVAGPAPALPARVQVAGGALALLPHGKTFMAPVTLHVPFDPTLAARAKGKPLKLFTAAPGGAWSAVAGARVGETAVDADVTHFSFFVVGFEAPEQTLPDAQIAKLDLLFMVDNSKSMQPLQQKLLASFPTLIRTLKALPGGLPDLHIGVVSSSMGAGVYDADEISSCPRGGDGGRLHWMPQGPCVDGGPTGHFIAAGAGESTKNYPGTIEGAFTCIAALGDQGCGFEHSLESMAVALGVRGAAPPENAGFLRADAALGLVMITNEDDCSAPADAMAVFDPTSRFVSDPQGPLSSYRCNEFGHRCAGKAPPRTPAGPETLTDCHSAEDGVLVRVAEYAQAFKALKADPSQVFLSVIAGPLTPYKVEPVTPTLAEDPSMWPAVTHSCMSTSGEYADPAVRLGDLVTAFGANGSLSSICDEFAPALTGIGAALGRTVGPRCLQADVVQAGAPPTLAAGCAVFESVAASGTRTETPLPACGASAVGPCWSVKANATCTPAGAELAVTRSDTPPASAVLVVRCTP